MQCSETSTTTLLPFWRSACLSRADATDLACQLKYCCTACAVLRSIAIGVIQPTLDPRRSGLTLITSDNNNMSPDPVLPTSDNVCPASGNLFPENVLWISRSCKGPRPTLWVRVNSNRIAHASHFDRPVYESEWLPCEDHPGKFSRRYVKNAACVYCM